MAPRDELVQLIEAYADAKVSGNQILRNMIGERLGQWLSKHDIVAPVAVPAEVKAAIDSAVGKTEAVTEGTNP